ncbi:hypothetical protein DBR32_15565 [Taibaiella sp. KBW10]|uniref:hypothetical protein n=1 Tax=Taibaiella sp. KBW10 TaxID=2153357 RepID=UPI000F5B0D67|nr:hypothetical protein [Taibaiella sp. KBW10]RQO29675.1 hypothetical protein DBR32_15565 [Taibaiella sp. KBW10]
MKQNLLLRVLTINLLLGGSLFAQNPGGVPVAAWYRADVPANLCSDAGFTTTEMNNFEVTITPEGAMITQKIVKE